MGAKHQKIAIKIPAQYKPQERLAIAQEVIDYIRDRTAKGQDKNDKKWSGSAAKYSESYKKSIDFKNAGKGNLVDLKLSGDMLAALTLINEKKGQLVIGFQNGTPENAKADGNIRGTYGQTKPTGKARDFLGISQQALEKILSRYPIDDREARAERAQKIVESSEVAQEFLDIEHKTT